MVAGEGDGQGGALHCVYGLRLETDFPLSFPLPRAKGRPDLRFRVAASAPDEAGGQPGEVLWESPERRSRGVPLTRLRRQGGWWRLTLDGTGDFWLDVGERRPGRVVAVPGPEVSPALVELRLLGPVLALVLELSGVVVLHASAVGVGDHPPRLGPAVALAATRGGGKSSLTGALMQRGCPLSTDDLLPIEWDGDRFVARPGYPQMRLWPADAARLSAGSRLPRVLPHEEKRRLVVGGDGFGRFSGAPRRLQQVLLLQRSRAVREVHFEPLAPAEALMALVRESFLPRLVAGAGLQARRLALLSRLVDELSVRRLAYPSDLEELDAVAARVLADAECRAEA